MLVAAWYWLLFHLFQSEPVDRTQELSALRFATFLPAVLVALCRLSFYWPVLCSKLCWGLRIARRKLIIWQHDQIFLAPLLMVLAVWHLPWLLVDWLGMSAALSASLITFLVMLIARGMGPSVQQLQLTGVHAKFGTVHTSKDFVSVNG